jgi:multimeric flavodoxin WrbA
MIMGKRGGCVLKDEFYILEEAIMECDAIIFGCPTFEMTPTGTFKTVCDRLGPSHDISFRKVAIEEGLAAGKTPDQLPDMRSLKPRVGAFFSIGGAMTKNWLSFMLPTMYCLTMSQGIDVVDTFEYHGAMAYNHVVGNQPMMDRSWDLGKHVAEAVVCEDEAERRRWRGDHEGVCPVCHCDMLTVSKGGEVIECPVCGIYGTATIEDGKLKAHFSDEEQARSRLFYAGKLEHSTEIKTCAAPPGQIPNLKELLEPFRWE